jgi:hypothetical protein
MVHEPVAAVGVLGGHDDDEGLSENLLDDGVVLGSEEVIRGEESRVGRGDLVSMDAVGEPGDGGLGVDQRSSFRFTRSARIGETLTVLPDLGKARQVLFRADDGVDELPAFSGTGVLEDLDLLRTRVSESFEVVEHLGVRDDPLARRVTEDAREAWNARVVPGIRPELLASLAMEWTRKNTGIHRGIVNLTFQGGGARRFSSSNQLATT